MVLKRLGRLTPSAFLLTLVCSCAFQRGYQPLAYPHAHLALPGFSDSESATFILETDDPPQKVLDFYKAALRKDGWAGDGDTGGRLEYRRDQSNLVTGEQVINVQVFLARNGATRIEIWTVK